MLNARSMIGSHDVLLMTLDSLRYDVAVDVLRSGQMPHLARWLPGGAWEARHTPGNFTFSAHQAFFAGFLPTPIAPGNHPRLFAAEFPGSETTTDQTCTFAAADIVSGLAARGYHTVCIGGVGFFNKQSPLGSVLPGLFAESHWHPKFGVTDPRSTEHQIACAVDVLAKRSPSERVFIFINISAMHQPNCMYLDGALEDSPASQAAALAYVDRSLPPLWDALRARGPTLCIVCSDHGTAYGEDGYRGHRHNHRVVLTVPYAEFVLPAEKEAD